MELRVEEASHETVPFIYKVYEQNRAVLHGNYVPLDDWYKFLTYKGNDLQGW
jgi:hypothetical protein